MNPQSYKFGCKGVSYLNDVSNYPIIRDSLDESDLGSSLEITYLILNLSNNDDVLWVVR